VLRDTRFLVGSGGRGDDSDDDAREQRQRRQRRRGKKGGGDGDNVDIGKRRGETRDNPFDNLMRLPIGCVQHWKVNTDYIFDITSNDDGTVIFATSGDGTLSVFDANYVRCAGTSRYVTSLDANLDGKSNNGDDVIDRTTTWERRRYARSDNM
jgi:hypothetical protein